MTKIKKNKITLLISLVFIASILGATFPINIDTNRDDGASILSLVSADCDASCLYQYYKRIANQRWRRFVRSGSGGGGATQTSDGSFGGTVAMVIPCLCSGNLAFMLNPVAGDSGPYLVNYPSIKESHALFPGNHVVGKANQTSGTCSIYVVYYCYDYSTNYTVTLNPGIGTSATP